MLTITSEKSTLRCVLLVFTALLKSLFFASHAQANCKPIDFLALDISDLAPQAPPALRATHIAYPAIVFSSDFERLTLDGRRWVDIGAVRPGLTPRERLRRSTFMEQFLYRYPLDFDLTERETPYHDPGRIRHGPFFDLIYAASEPQVRASLVRVDFGRLASTGVMVTTQNAVNCQLGAVIAALQPFAADLAPFFATVGGGFNWRLISGTNRLSAHSYGIAVDINPALGGYWRWSGLREGQVAAFDNKVPQIIVAAFERYGFIWGGKWHHFDGMHFEYRPELILYARILLRD